jgi:Fe-S cluster biosynthesis and repair protein YggX
VAETDTITCVRCGREAARLPKPPIAGQLGQAVFEQVCADCWAEWRAQSVLLVNHYGLQPADPHDRAQLYEFMKEFFSLHE